MDYDNYKLATPWDNESNFEGFPSETKTFYSKDEDNMLMFLEELENLMDKYNVLEEK